MRRRWPKRLIWFVACVPWDSDKLNASPEMCRFTVFASLSFLLITDDQYTCLQQNRLVQAALCSSVAVQLCQFKSCSFSDKIPSYNPKYSRHMPSRGETDLAIYLSKTEVDVC
jgi:hypothetical protein